MSEQQDESQSEFIRNELRAMAKAGHDLTTKDTKVKAVKEVAKKVQEKWTGLGDKSAYAAVTRQVNTVVTDIARGVDPSIPHRPVQSNTGGAEVKITMPPAAPKEAQRPQAPAAPTGQSGKVPPMQAGQRVLEDMSIMQTDEFQYVYLQYYTAFLQLRGGIAGVFGTTKVVARKSEYKELAQQWAVAHVRYHWDFPDWLNKALLIAGTVSVVAMPIVTKTNIIELLTGGGNKKAADGSTPKEPPRSEEPLA